ncbi:unnamed protein product [Blepharisma stoltei]|uniref:Uncharacterized protein n=1 Tax=Blepharisma stoltei TaxID=1481888 RepID=A0AAU9JKB4_9CILI|nr:unnamed protein product [Blepharisma stoltei]
MSNFLNDITDAVKLISKSITDHLDSNQLKALKEIKMRWTAEISQIISRSELNRNRSWKEIFLAYFFRAISLNRVLNPRIKLVKFIIGNIEEMEPNNPMVDPLIYEYFIYSLIKVACLEIDNKSCKNTITHVKNRLFQVDCSTEPISDDCKNWIQNTFRTSFLDGLFNEQFPDWRSEIECILQKSYFSNFMQDSEKGLLLEDDYILLPDKFKGNESKNKLGLLLAFAEQFWQSLNTKINTNFPQKRKCRDEDKPNLNKKLEDLLGGPLYFISNYSAGFLLGANQIDRNILKEGFPQLKENNDYWTNVIQYDTVQFKKSQLWSDINLENFQLKSTTLVNMQKYYYQIDQIIKRFLSLNEFIDHKNMFFVICGLSIQDSKKSTWYGHFKKSGLNLYWKALENDYSTIINLTDNSAPFMLFYVYDYFIREITLNRQENSCESEFEFVSNLTGYHKPFFQKLSTDEIDKIKWIFLTEYIWKFFMIDPPEYEVLLADFLNKTFKYNLSENNIYGKVLINNYTIVNDFSWIESDKIKQAGIIFSLVNCFYDFLFFQNFRTFQDKIKNIRNLPNRAAFPYLKKINLKIAEFMTEEQNFNDNFENQIINIQSCRSCGEESIWMQPYDDDEIKDFIEDIYPDSFCSLLKHHIWDVDLISSDIEWNEIKDQYEEIYIGNERKHPSENGYLIQNGTYEWGSAFKCFLLHLPKMMHTILKVEGDAESIRKRILSIRYFFMEILTEDMYEIWKKMAMKNNSFQALIIDYFYTTIESFSFADMRDAKFYFSNIKSPYDKIHLIRIRDEIKLVTRKFLNFEIIKNCYDEICEQINLNNQEYKDLIENALNKALLIKFRLGIYGKTTCNDQIFISNFWYRDDVELRAGAILVTFVHEFAHLLGRSKMKNLSEKLLYQSPKIIKYSKNKNEYESGYQIEKKIFGEHLEKISKPAAHYILTLENIENLEQFQKEFKEENHMKGAEFIKLNKKEDMGDDTIELGECGNRRPTINRNLFKDN